MGKVSICPQNQKSIVDGLNSLSYQTNPWVVSHPLVGPNCVSLLNPANNLLNQFDLTNLIDCDWLLSLYFSFAIFRVEFKKKQQQYFS